MGDSENKETVEQNEPKKTENTGVATKKAKGRFSALKAEFRRIIWPDKNRIIKETTAVVIVTIILGAVIALLDFVIKAGLDKILQMG